MVSYSRSVWLALILSLFAPSCGKNSASDPQGGNGNGPKAGATLADYLFEMPTAGVTLESVPAGTYKLSEIRSISRPVDSTGTTVFIHQAAKVGEISRDKDTVFSFADLNGFDFKNKIYNLAFSVQLPMTVEASASGMDFGSRSWYWQRYDQEYKVKESWYLADTPISTDNYAHTSDIDLEEMFKTKGRLDGGVYINDSLLAFEGFFLSGERGSKAALQVGSNGDLFIYIQYVLDPTYYDKQVKINQLARLQYKRQ